MFLPAIACILVSMPGLILSGKGLPLPNHSNAVYVLQHEPIYAVDRLWYDEFLDRVFISESPARAWRDEDDTNVTVAMQSRYGLTSINQDTVSKAVRFVARQRSRHAVRDWLVKLEWDGIERIGMAFTDYWGAAEDTYTRAASRNFFIGMVARILLPGCKLDTMPVFEGPQGIRKSSALAVLGGQFTATSHHAAGGVEFLKVMRGKWLIEIAELQSFTKADVTAAKNMLSTATDSYRPSYGRHVIDFPRQCVFAGTTNADDWGSDDTGLRRFWPIKCGEIKIDLIAKAREQMFAEAVAAVQAGAYWWEMPTGTSEIQAERQYTSEWTSIVLTWCDDQPPHHGIQIKDILTGALKFSADRIGKGEEMRVASILRKARWERTRGERTANHQPWVWRKGEHNDELSTSEHTF